MRPEENLHRVVFFTAVLTWEREKQLRHRNNIAAQKAMGVEVVESNFRKVSRHCRVMARTCARHEEKQTDVALAISVFADAMANDFDRAIIVTADSDQIPLVKALHSHFPAKGVTLAAPPGRASAARELGALFRDRTPITVGRIRACQLPRDVFDEHGRRVATMPALYTDSS